MVIEIIRFIAFVLSGLLAVICLAVLASIVRKGPSGIADLSRSGVNLRNWANGSIPDPRDSTSIDVIEGIDIVANGNVLVSARQTRGVSSEY